jgi:flagellar basal-body rod modification protein FlgD
LLFDASHPACDYRCGINDVFLGVYRIDNNNELPSGTYTVVVDAVDTQEDVIDTTTVVTSRVRGIEQQDGIVYALVGDRAVPVTSILNAAVPPESAPVEGGSDESST